MKKFYFLLSLIVFVSACTYDNIEEYFGETCPPPTVSYATQVDSLLTIRCGACHLDGNNLGSVTLDTYDEVKTYVDNGELLKVIKHESGVAPMPQGSPKLPPEDIMLIEKWIHECAKDN